MQPEALLVPFQSCNRRLPVRLARLTSTSKTKPTRRAHPACPALGRDCVRAAPTFAREQGLNAPLLLR